MTTLDSTPAAAVLVAIDIAKLRNAKGSAPAPVAQPAYQGNTTAGTALRTG